MLENASKKQWTNCDVVINGARFHNVGIRTKGDSSLSSVAEVPDCNRYSFKLQFDKYTKGQLCWGLDKLCLNNNYGDATNMKEAFVYDTFKYLGADASLYNFASVSVNGNYWGAYLALEAAEDSFLERNYGNGEGALYKPGSEKGLEDEWEWDEYETLQSSEGNSVTGGEETFSWDDADMDNGGADLNYIDDNLDSYPGIFSCNVNKTTRANHLRVVEALKNISQKRNLEKYMDMENLLRYMAAHNFSVNNDSLSGDGAHNYYLYESEGRLNLIPWDYNLCFGAYAMEESWTADERGFARTETATDVINKPIDDSWRLTSFFDGILQNDEYRAKYHAYYQKLVDGYILGGGFDAFYARTRAQIDSLVKADPNAFYSYEAYDAAAAMFQKAVKLRGQSVSGQLSGAIPSTLEGQKNKPESLIDASSIHLQVMGTDNVGEEGDWEDDSEEGGGLRNSSVSVDNPSAS